MDPRIGILTRDGVTIYYANLGPSARYFEHKDVDEVVFQLHVSDRQLAPRCPSCDLRPIQNNGRGTCDTCATA